MRDVHCEGWTLRGMDAVRDSHCETHIILILHVVFGSQQMIVSNSGKESMEEGQAYTKRGKRGLSERTATFRTLQSFKAALAEFLLQRCVVFFYLRLRYNRLPTWCSRT